MLPNAFYVEDILLLILDHIAYRHDVYTWKIDCKISHLKEGAKERLQVLASLARVCRFISGFALDRLWWPLFDLKQLCRVLPNVKETRFKDGAGKDCVRMVCPIIALVKTCTLTVFLTCGGTSLWTAL